MLTIHYAPSPGVSDFELEIIYQSLLKRAQRGDVVTICSTENLFLRVRVGIKEGDISHEDVKFVYQDHEIRPFADGRITYWPKGFLDVADQMLERLFSV